MAKLFLLNLFATFYGTLSTFKGFVSPLKHLDPSTGNIRAFSLHDSEPVEDLQAAIVEFLEKKDDHLQTVAKLSRRRVGTERCNTRIGVQNLWPHAVKLEEAGIQLHRRYINIGANDGVNDDPLYEYAKRLNASGVAIERDETLCSKHRENLPEVQVVCDEVTPYNVVSLLSSTRIEVPDRHIVDILKVDIDSYDCSVLQELLEVVDARMVLVEVNPSVPPPYRWAMLYHPELWTFFFKQPSLQEVPIRGCSLAFQVDLLRRFGFHLLAFGGHDALFVHTSAAAAFAPLQPPVDEFDCYNEAFIAANGIPIEKTRRWFFTQSNVSAGLIELWDFFTDWMRTHGAPEMFPFALYA